MFNEASIWRQPGFRVIHHYCVSKAPGFASASTTVGIIRNLCAQLARSKTTGVRAEVLSFYESECDAGKKDSSNVPYSRWQRLFTTLVDTNQDRVLVALDALDECENAEIDDLLTFLAEIMVDRPNLSLVCSSRESVPLQEYFLERVEIVQCSPQATRIDMSHFVDTRLAALQRRPATKRSIFCESVLRTYTSLADGYSSMRNILPSKTDSVKP